MSIPLVEQAKNRVTPYLKKGGIAIDATMGNGFDTLFLAENLANTGHVYAFDIQPRALETTDKRLKEAGLTNYRLLLDNHDQIASYLAADNINAICCAMFNLGYLPGSDKTQKTSIAATLKALNDCLSALQAPGIISVLAYTGHAGGAEETEAVKAWAQGLNKGKYCVSITVPTTLRNSPPELIIIETL